MHNKDHPLCLVFVIHRVFEIDVNKNQLGFVDVELDLGDCVELQEQLHGYTSMQTQDHLIVLSFETGG